jgi:hypothetical protein
MNKRSAKMRLLLSIIVALIILGIFFYLYLIQQTSAVVDGYSFRNYTTDIIINGTYSCPAASLYAQSIINSSSGFGAYNSSRYQGLTDYVIPPGSAGTITYKFVRKPSPSGYYIYYIIANIRNYALFSIMSDPQQIDESLQQAGISLNFTPQSEIIFPNGTYTIKTAIKSSSNAQLSTYEVILNPGCGGGAGFLLTVGNGPYNGTLPPPVIP